MAMYVTFSYTDTLPESILRKLPAGLKVSGNKDVELLLILRLLSGNVALTHNYTNSVIKTKTNYFSSDFVLFKNWKKDFPVLFSENSTADDIAVFIDKTKYVNRSFYKAILAEFSQFLLHSKRNSHTSAFIYIYRILEKISYAFPLIYASKTQDFLKSFGQLKELMIGDGEKKELGFFKTFINLLYDGDGISYTSVDIKFNATDPTVREQMFRSIKEAIDNYVLHEDTVEFDMLSVKYCEMGSFIINVRNRFFHNLNGGAKNIESDRIVDSDQLFSFINPMAMQWLAMIFLKITAYSLSEFQTHRQNAAST